jgi:hypothetical protein
MERHDIDSATAFQMLVETSQSENIKLYEVADWLVEHRAER